MKINAISRMDGFFDSKFGMPPDRIIAREVYSGSKKVKTWLTWHLRLIALETIN